MSLWNWKRSGWLNLCLAIFLIASVIISICSYGFRSEFQDIAPNFRCHGGVSPEVGIFNSLLFCCSILGFVSVTLRYSYIMDQIQVMALPMNYINKISVPVGFISFLGLIFMVSFSTLLEEASLFQSIAMYVFTGVGLIFTLLQTFLTFKISRYSLMFLVRLFLAITLLSSFLTSIIFLTENKVKNELSSNNSLTLNNDTEVQFTRNNETEISISPKREGLLLACIFEWICVIIYALFHLSFFQEFQTISAYIIVRPFITTSTPNDFRSSSVTVNERI